MAPTIRAVLTISTLHDDAPRHTSTVVASIRADSSAARAEPPLRLRNPNVAITMAMQASADGSLDVYSLTWPVTDDTAAMHHAKNGGLYGISLPKLTGRIQFPESSIETATIASLGSPLVLNRASPSHGRNITHTIASNIHAAYPVKKSLSFMLLFFFFPQR